MRIIYLLWCIFAALAGVFFIRYPNRAISIQQKFYARINWRIEPISFSKEIRNTRIMGIVLLCAVLVAFSLFRACPN
ncbi:MAG: hypothetical protein WCI77_08425 [Candidatus Omnitrophota bacterium]